MGAGTPFLYEAQGEVQGGVSSSSHGLQQFLPLHNFPWHLPASLYVMSMALGLHLPLPVILHPAGPYCEALERSAVWVAQLEACVHAGKSMSRLMTHFLLAQIPV